MQNTHTPENQRLVELLQRVSLRDHAAFKQLYDLTSAHMYGVALRFVRKREIADEILQEAFISIWQQAGSYASTLSTPMTWMISVVRNKALDRLRRVKLEASHSCESEEEAGEFSLEDRELGKESEELLESAAERIALRRCVTLLDPPQRQSLALVYYNGLSHAELAAHLQVPLGTAKAWVRRGLERLRTCLERGTGHQAQQGR